MQTPEDVADAVEKIARELRNDVLRCEKVKVPVFPVNSRTIFLQHADVYTPQVRPDML